MQDLDLTLFRDDSSSVISENHFGLNLEFGYESIGDLPWNRFDEVFSESGSKIVRYPGGSETELYFDITDPNRTSVKTASGKDHSLTPQDVVIAHAAQTGSTVSIVLPSARFLTEDAYGTRRFDEQHANDLYEYISQTLLDAGEGLIEGFELGNEYEAYMTSQEYGALAARMAEIVDAAIQNISSSGGFTGAPPDIFVQAWALSIQGANSVEDLAARNAIVIDQFSPTQLDLIDGVVSHYYFLPGRHSGEDAHHTPDNITGSTAPIARLHDAWSAASGRDLKSYVSEWNVSHHSTEYTGLKQTGLLLDIFSSFVLEGADAMSFWSSQYHATSLGDRQGHLQSAGTAVSYLADNLIGMRAVQAELVGDFASATAFADDGRLIISISSIVSEEITFRLDPQFLGYTLDFQSAVHLAVVDGTADGVFKQRSGLKAYEDPDATFEIAALETKMSLDGLEFTLDPHETAFIEFTIVETTRPRANIPETFTFISYIDRKEGIELDMDGLAGSDDSANRSRTDPLNIALEATAFNDVIWGSRQADIIFGDDGDDLLNGRFGDDQIDGGAGNDTILGGHGNDTIDGGAGFDYLGYWTSERGMIVNMDAGTATDGLFSNDSFRGIEGVFLSHHDDIIHDAVQDNHYVLGGGNDIVYWKGGSDTIDGGSGYDTLYITDVEQGQLVIAKDGSLSFTISGSDSAKLESFEGLNFNGQEFRLSDFDASIAISLSDLQELVKLYVAYFNRAADNLGVLFWADKVAEGMSFADVIDSFSESEEYISAFESNDSNAAFVERVYENVLGRASDQSGLIFWTNALDHGVVSRAEFVQQFLGGMTSPDSADDLALVTAKTALGVRSALVDQINDVSILQDAMGRLSPTTSIDEIWQSQDILNTADAVPTAGLTIDIQGALDFSGMF